MKMLKNIGVPLAAISLAGVCASAANVGTGCVTLKAQETTGIPNAYEAVLNVAPGSAIPSGAYDVFCANIAVNIYSDAGYAFSAWSIDDTPKINQFHLVFAPDKLDEVEFILNQFYPTQTAQVDGLPFTPEEVQVAIWTFVDGPTALATHNFGGLAGFSQAHVDEIVQQANAADGYKAPCGAIKAYLLSPVSDFNQCGMVFDPETAPPFAQPLVIGVPTTCPPPPLEVPVTLLCASNQTGDQGQPYSAQMVASGGEIVIGQTAVDYTFSLTDGSLPPGVLLNSDTGVIAGIPTAAGTFTFTVAVTDGVGNTGFHTTSKQCSITIAPPPPPPLVVACASVTTGRAGLPYSANIAVSGGVSPYAFTAVNLPSWLNLNPTTGALSGTPPTAGVFPFSVTVTDSAGTTLAQTKSVSCSVTVAPACTPVTVGCVSDNTGVVGEPYSSSLSVSGGVAPYNFYVIYGCLPAGLTLNPNTGVISGTPTSSGYFDFTIKVVDSAAAACGCNSYATVCCRITVTANCPPIALSCVSTATGKVGTSFSGSLSATGGVAPYTFSIISGYLPAGLTLNPATGAIAGTPSCAGTFSFTAKVAGANYSACGCYGYATVCCSIKIDPAPAACVELVCGDTATIGYWNGPNGQALIKSLNGGPAAKNLGNWLAATYPYLWGANAGTKNMAGKTNDQVAAFFRSLFATCGNPKTEAQMLAVALAVYVTDSDLAGTTAQACGFNVSSAGTGGKCYNVGTYGCYVGLTNCKSYSVSALLAQANSKKRSCAFNPGAFNCIFDGINRKGDRL